MSETAKAAPAGARLLRRDEGPGPTIVLVHPVHGDSRAYQPLADALAGPVRVYGIDAAGLSGDEEPLDELEPMIERSVEIADALAAAGPVHVGGASAGGVIAVNAAERLAARGRDVGVGFVVDAPAPHDGMRQRPLDRVSLAGLFVRASAAAAGASFPEATLERGTAEEVAKVLASAELGPLLGDVPLERQLAVVAGCIRAYFRHPQRALTRDVLFVESEDVHPQHPKPASFGWEDLAPRLDRATCPGTHFTLLQPPNAPGLAAVLSARITARTT